MGRLDVGRDDEGAFLDLLDSVTSSENKGWEGRCGESRSDGVSLLVLVDLDVPFPPSLGRGEHSTTSAHVTESSLSGSLGTTTTDTGDSGNSSSSSPRLGRGLVTSLLGNGVSLSPVLGHGLWLLVLSCFLVLLSSCPPLIQFALAVSRPSSNPAHLYETITHCGPAGQHQA